MTERTLPSTERESIDVVDFELRRVPYTQVMKEAFELRPERGHVWLQKCCLWVLKKLGCFASFETVKIDRHYVGRRGSTFMQRLWDRRNLIHGSFDRQPTQLLIGADDYARMMEEEFSKVGFGFNGSYCISKGPGREATIMGLKVEVIPWMKGMLLL